MVLALGTLTANAFADGVIRDSLGARSSGRGGTNLAFEDNGEVLYDNPAGIARIDGEELFEVGFDVLITDLKYSDPDNDLTGASNNPFPMGQFSYIRRSQDGVWAYGIGAYSVAGFSCTYDMVGPPILGGEQRYKSLGAMAKVLPALACRVTDRMTVGGTLGVAASHMELEGPYFLQQSGLPIALDLQASGAAPTWSLGMQFELTDDTTLGLAYTSQTSFDLHGSAQVATFFGSTRYDTVLDVTWPQSLGLGVKHRLCKHQIVAADVVWYDWSKAFNEFQLSFNNPTNGIFPQINEQFPLHWQDSISIRTGYEVRPVENRVIRLGYIYHHNPIPSDTLTPFIQATLEHTASIGYGWVTASQWEVDLAYQYSVGGGNNVGISSLAGGDFNNSRHEAEVHWVFASLLRKF